MLREARVQDVEYVQRVLRVGKGNVWHRKMGRWTGKRLRRLDRFLAVLAVLFAKFYQRHWQPESGCLYDPVCSDYGIAAFQNHGFHDGIIMSAARIQRCNPDGKEQYYALHPELGDPVHGHDPCPGRGRVYG